MYPCGLRGGEILRLRQELICREIGTGRITDRYAKGSFWQVIGGDTDKGDVVWLWNPDGERHTWDNESIFEWFDVVAGDGHGDGEPR